MRQDSADEFKIYTAKMIKIGQPYKCALLKKARTSEAKARVFAYTYYVDVPKADLISDRLLKTAELSFRKVK